MPEHMDTKEKLKSHADLLDEMADTCTGGFVHIIPDTAKEIADDIKEHLEAEEKPDKSTKWHYTIDLSKLGVDGGETITINSDGSYRIEPTSTYIRSQEELTTWCERHPVTETKCLGHQQISDQSRANGPKRP